MKIFGSSAVSLCLLAHQVSAQLRRNGRDNIIVDRTERNKSDRGENRVIGINGRASPLTPLTPLSSYRCVSNDDVESYDCSSTLKECSESDPSSCLNFVGSRCIQVTCSDAVTQPIVQADPFIQPVSALLELGYERLDFIPYVCVLDSDPLDPKDSQCKYETCHKEGDLTEKGTCKSARYKCKYVPCVAKYTVKNNIGSRNVPGVWHAGYIENGHDPVEYAPWKCVNSLDEQLTGDKEVCNTKTDCYDTDTDPMEKGTCPEEGQVCVLQEICPYVLMNRNQVQIAKGGDSTLANYNIPPENRVNSHGRVNNPFPDSKLLKFNGGP